MGPWDGVDRSWAGRGRRRRRQLLVDGECLHARERIVICRREVYAADGVKGLTCATMEVASAAFEGMITVLVSLARLPKALTYCSARAKAAASLPACNRGRLVSPFHRARSYFGSEGQGDALDAVCSSGRSGNDCLRLTARPVDLLLHRRLGR